MTAVPVWFMLVFFSTVPVWEAEAAPQPMQSTPVSTLQQPLLPLPDAPENCPSPPALPGAETGSPAASSGSTISQKKPSTAAGSLKPFTIVLFWGDGCPHCADEKDFLKELGKQYPSMSVKLYEVWYDRNNAALLNRLAGKYGLTPGGVPVTFIGSKAFVGFSNTMKNELLDLVKKCSGSGCPDPLISLQEQAVRPSAAAGPAPKTAARQSNMNAAASQSAGTAMKPDANSTGGRGELIDIPLLGRFDPAGMSLPVMTIVIAGLDSFNPCAFFVLFALLGLLVHARSRARMLFIGGIFVFFSGFIYFVFMAAWLNLFLVMGQVALITAIAGIVSILIAAINIKDFFSFKTGVSLTIPDSAKPKLFDRMRKLMRSTSVASMIVGSAVLAIVANSYELLCTAGFPMVFTRILTLNQLPLSIYYCYLMLYNLIYIIPLAVIVIIFTHTLGKKQLTERQGRVLKLVSGMMMLGLGTVLLLRPALLNNMLASISLLVGAVLISCVVMFADKKFNGIRNKKQP